MNQQCVVGVFENVAGARPTLHELEQAGFSKDDVSLVTSCVEGQSENPEMLEFGDKSASRAVQGASAGGLVGFLLGSPLLLLPGVGPILIAGPIMLGSMAGGFLGAMAGWGVDAGNLKKYDQQVREGAVLVIVQGAPDDVARAQQILRDSSATEVNLHAKSSTDSPEIDDRPAQASTHQPSL